MDGIFYLSDEKNKKRYVQIDLEKYGQLWEDFYDAVLVASRAKEPRETLASVKRRLKLSKADG